ncbi:hypothetical protein GCM10022398_05820 [Acetobacter lovaniensis]|nr:hypothetical protein AA0474_3042 [Acetobacter lovaniensis NRIC 0474]
MNIMGLLASMQSRVRNRSTARSNSGVGGLFQCRVRLWGKAKAAPDACRTAGAGMTSGRRTLLRTKASWGVPGDVSSAFCAMVTQGVPPARVRPHRSSVLAGMDLKK